jgi:hypothetical protein
MNLFDLSKFAKTAEDKNSTTMRHSDGHEIKIVHSALPKLKQEQLKRLKMAEGGEARKMYAEPDETVSKNDSAPTDQPAAPANITINTAQPQMPQAVVPPQIQNPASISNAASPPIPENIPQQPANAIQSPLDQTGQLNPSKQTQMVQQATDFQKNIDIEKGKQLANVQAGMNAANVNQAQNLTNNYNTAANQTKATAEWMLDPKNQINPNQYLENRSVGQKIANAFGLLAGGIKQGLIGGDNPAMTFMNNQIQRDIEAQKSRQDQVKTVYGYYKDLYGEGNVTNNLTQAAMNNIYDGKVKKIALDMATPQAVQAAQMFSAQKGAENQKLLQDSATQLNALPGFNGTNPKTAPAGAPPQGAGPAPSATPFSPENMKTPTPGKETPAQEKELPYEATHILSPNHEDAIKKLMYTPKAKDNMAAIQAQYNQATQAEKGLGSIHDTFQKLTKSSNKTGELGNLRRNFQQNISSIPLVGGALSAIPKYLTDTESNRAYDADKVSLLGYVSSALKGTNIGSGQIQEIVDTNSPEYGDSAALVAKKENNIREFIKNHTDTSLLDTWGLSAKKGK